MPRLVLPQHWTGNDHLVPHRFEIENDASQLPRRRHVEMTILAPEAPMDVAMNVRPHRPTLHRSEN